MLHEHFANPPHVSIPIIDDRVLQAMDGVPRDEFVPGPMKQSAYGDTALPIGHGQTISQPYIVALMTQLLELAGSERVLEIGTGSGYQTILLARLAGRVHTIERIEDLHHQAKGALRRLGETQVHCRLGDGTAGWPEAAPFDRIIVTCAARNIPEALFEQLAPGGWMIVPVGDPGGTQQLMRVVRTEDGAQESQMITTVRFVPMKHD